MQICEQAQIWCASLPLIIVVSIPSDAWLLDYKKFCQASQAMWWAVGIAVRGGSLRNAGGLAAACGVVHAAGL